MPVFSRFEGITLYMNINDHLPPHFHARFGGTDASIDIDSWRVKGAIDRKKLLIVLEWAKRNRDALMVNWDLTRQFHDPLWIGF